MKSNFENSIEVVRPKKVGDSVSILDFAKRPARVESVDIAFYNFGNLFSKLVNAITREDDRMQASTPTIRVLSLDKPGIIDNHLSILKLNANKPLNKISDDDRKDYLHALKEICLLLHTNGSWNVDINIVPLRGGAIIANSIPNIQNYFPIDSKRIPLAKKNDLGLALRLAQIKADQSRVNKRKLGEKYVETIKSINGKKIRILEAAVASGLTTIGYLLELDYYKVKPTKIEVLTPVSNFEGIKMLLQVASKLGFNVVINTGQVFYRLGDFWEDTADSIKYDDGNFVIGKATHILKKYLDDNIHYF